MRILLEHGADPNIPDNNKRTPLMLAALDVGTEPGIMEALISHGADINAQNVNGYTALSEAAFCGHSETVRVLMKNGADPDIPAKEGWTALMWTIKHNSLIVVYAALKREAQLDSIRLLVSRGADVDIPDKKGMNAVMCAMMNGDDEAIEILTDNEEE